VNWTVTASQTEEEWFEEYAFLALSSKTPSLPPASQRIGSTDTVWFITEPGIAVIHSNGGSPADRVFASSLVRNQLYGHGIRQAEFNFDADEDMRKTATWNDIEAKALRLVQSGNVTLHVNSGQNIVGTVVGDHDTYATEIMRQDPSSRAITQWHCTCPWNQYAFQRTRQWKKYEGRCCSHTLALYWKSLSTPLDEDMHPANGGQQSLFDAPQTPTGGPTGSPAPFAAPTPGPPQGDQLPIPGMNPGQATGTPPGPSIIPPYPLEPDPNAPVVNPASVPGLRQPSPTNPIQYPGGTFSSVQDDWEFDTVQHMAATFTNGQIVSTKVDDWGTLIGRSEEHGSGQSVKIPKGSVGEVLGEDPTTGMVNVLFENKMTENMGNLQPNGVVAWFFPSEVNIRMDIRPPGPAVRRR
jgi:hypothetical protein